MYVYVHHTTYTIHTHIYTYDKFIHLSTVDIHLTCICLELQSFLHVVVLKSTIMYVLCHTCMYMYVCIIPGLCGGTLFFAKPGNLRTTTSQLNNDPFYIFFVVWRCTL